MVDNFLVMSIYIITGFHAVYIYSVAMINLVQKHMKKKQAKKVREMRLI